MRLGWTKPPVDGVPIELFVPSVQSSLLSPLDYAEPPLPAERRYWSKSIDKWFRSAGFSYRHEPKHRRVQAMRLSTVLSPQVMVVPARALVGEAHDPVVDCLKSIGRAVARCGRSYLNRKRRLSRCSETHD